MAFPPGKVPRAQSHGRLTHLPLRLATARTFCFHLDPMNARPNPTDRQLLTRLGWLVGAGAFFSFALGLMFFSRSAPPQLPSTPEAAAAHPAPQLPAAESLHPPATFAGPPLTADELRWATRLNDASLSFAERREAADALAQSGSPAARACLAAALTGPIPPPLVSHVATLLAESKDPLALEALRQALQTPNETAAAAAARALAAQGDPADAQRLGEMLFDDSLPESLRAELALALGDIPGPEALHTLARAASQLTDENLSDEIWRALGQRPFRETESVFHSYLSNPDISADAKAAALDALSDAPGDVAPFLLQFLQDPENAVRLAAASSLGMQDLLPGQISRVVDALVTESAPEVRRSLYQALAMQPNVEPDALLRLTETERDPGARMALFNLLAAASQSEGAAPTVQALFDRSAVQELTARALGSGPYDQRLDSITILGRARTPQSAQALEALVGSLKEPGLQEAARNAIRPRQQP